MVLVEEDGDAPGGWKQKPSVTFGDDVRDPLVKRDGLRCKHVPPIEMLDRAVEHIGFGWFQWKMFILVAFAKFVDAMETAMLPLLFPVLKEKWRLHNTDLACVACATQVGMLLGAVTIGRISDNVGRRLPLQVSLAWLMAFGLASAFAPNILTFIAFRALLGIGYGGNMVMAYTLLAEVLPNKQRGPCLAALDIFFGLGALASTLLCWAVIPTIGWRWLIIICILCCTPVAVGVCCFPDSPRYQCATGQYGKCIRTLKQMAKANGKEMPTWMTLENMRIANSARKRSVIEVHVETSLFLALRPYLFILLPLGSIWFFNAFASVVVSWVPLWLAEAGHNSMSAVYLLAVVDTLGCLCGGLFMAALLSGSVTGKRLILLRCSVLVVGILCFVMGFMSAVGVAALTTMLFFVEVMKTGVVNVLYTYTPEVFPTRIRSTAFGICSGLHRLAPALSPFLISYLMDHFNFLVLCSIFAGLFGVTLLLSFFLRKETAGLSIAEDLAGQPGSQPGSPKRERRPEGTTYGTVPASGMGHAIEAAAQIIPMPWYRRMFCNCKSHSAYPASQNNSSAAASPSESGGPITAERRGSSSSFA